MPDLLLWVCAVLAALTAMGLLVSRDWRWNLSLLAVQYLAGFGLVLSYWQLTMAASLLVVGWMAAAILGMTQANLKEELAAETSWPEGRLFRAFAVGLVLLVISAASISLADSLLNAKPPVVWGALALIGLGLLHLGLTMRPLRVILGLFTSLTGFEIFFSILENSILVAGLLAIVTLGLALAGSYLITIADGAEQPA